jgi:exosortase/archaeosortase family protein
MNNKQVLNLIFRYFLLVLVAIPNLLLFYKIFTPLTSYTVFWILNSTYSAKLLSLNLIFFNGIYIELIPACIAGSAYYLLLVLNLTTPMPLKKRIKSILFLFASFFAINVIRIVVFATLIVGGFQYFDLTHNITWHAGSTILLVILWFINVKLFKIHNIPVYTDFGEMVAATRTVKKEVSKKAKSKVKKRKSKNK